VTDRPVERPAERPAACPACAWPLDEPYEVVSRHATSEGVVTYTRCACGEMRVTLRPYGGAETLRP
jgi:hypothetical protein